MCGLRLSKSKILYLKLWSQLSQKFVIRECANKSDKSILNRLQVNTLVCLSSSTAKTTHSCVYFGQLLEYKLLNPHVYFIFLGIIVKLSATKNIMDLTTLACSNLKISKSDARNISILPLFVNKYTYKLMCHQPSLFVQTKHFKKLMFAACFPMIGQGWQFLFISMNPSITHFI